MPSRNRRLFVLKPGLKFKPLRFFSCFKADISLIFLPWINRVSRLLNDSIPDIDPSSGRVISIDRIFGSLGRDSSDLPAKLGISRCSRLGASSRKLNSSISPLRKIVFNCEDIVHNSKWLVFIYNVF